MATAIRDPRVLFRILGLDPRLAGVSEGSSFPLRVPRGYVARMRQGDPNDPLLRQVLPIEAEGLAVRGYAADPLNECAAVKTARVLRKYDGRLLLMPTSACAIHCRYCFRRHFPYSETTGDLEAAVAYVRADRSVSEVILSGGDPLCLSDEKLAHLVARLAEIPQLRRLRIHTRLPVALPERVDSALMEWLSGTRLATIMVVHVNHANEIDAAVETALRRIGETGTRLLNQSVLLRGVNDGAPQLADLSERLFEAGVLPYYLHLLDRVAGAAHFEVGERRAGDIMGTLRAKLPGYLVPRLVREVAGAAYKQPALSG